MEAEVFCDEVVGGEALGGGIVALGHRALDGVWRGHDPRCDDQGGLTACMFLRGHQKMP